MEDNSLYPYVMMIVSVVAIIITMLLPNEPEYKPYRIIIIVVLLVLLIGDTFGARKKHDYKQNDTYGTYGHRNPGWLFDYGTRKSNSATKKNRSTGKGTTAMRSTKSNKSKSPTGRTN